tara:strand:+ start:35273 stop:37231 length:1959 start_codon:yes stop_codon:yes gene_type:complete
MSRFYVTTAIDYVNSRPHLGTAYEKIAADVIARYKRLSGVDTLFVMGNDEHSQNVYQRAKEQNMDPLEFCDQMDAEFRDVWQHLGVSFDDFLRTTQERHRIGVTTMVQKLADNGDLYEGAYEGWYCISCEAFKQEKDLIDENCPVHQIRPQWIKEKNHFFRLSKYRDRLLEHYTAHPEFLQPDIRRNEVLRFIEAGPEDISISRTGQSWGIPVPFDPDSVVYVWVDALINYVSAVGYGTDEDLFEKWWPANLHIIGKDITRFHCVIWPAMLMSAGLPLPQQVFGHGWVHWKGQKMSKSLGTVLDPLEAANRLGPDPLRLYLTKAIGFGQDGDFTWERFGESYNADLANNFGNLVSRFSSMVDRYRSGKLSPPSQAAGPLASLADDVVGRYRVAMDSFALDQATGAVFELIDGTNEFITVSQPWTVAKERSRSKDLDQQLYEIGEALRVAALLLMPVMPTSCAEVLKRVGESRPVSDLRLDRDALWSTSNERMIIKADALWPRLDSSQDTVSVLTTNKSKERGQGPEKAMMQQESETQSSTETSLIGIDDFSKVELRVGKVVSAELVPKSRKLLCVKIDTGSGEKQIVAGIAGSYQPEALVGKLIVFVANLKPATLVGVESQGMILAATGEDGKATLLTVDDAASASPGAQVR